MNLTCLVQGHQFPYVLGNGRDMWASRCRRCGRVEDRPRTPDLMIHLPDGYSPEEVAAFWVGWNTALGHDPDDPRDWSV